MPSRFGFPKKERLKSRKQIDALFTGGKAVSSFPVKALYRFAPSGEVGLQVGVTASKKNFKRAVDRNRIKRLLREAYRLQKEELLLLCTEAGKTGNLFFVYTDKTLPSFDTVKTAVAKCLQRLGKIVQSEEPA